MFQPTPYNPATDPDFSFVAPHEDTPQMGTDGFILPPLALSARIGSPSYASFLNVGASTKDCILRSLPANWDFKGKRVLDFGCGIGRVLRRFAHEAQEAEIWGCDIDIRSIMWLNEHFSPPFHVFQNSENAVLPLESNSFDLVFAISVFSHLSTTWNQWLSELRRILKPGGYAFFSFLHRGPYESIYGQPFPAEPIHMLVKHPHQPWDMGGPTVFISPQWLIENWGNLFDIEFIALGGLSGFQSIAFMRKPQLFSAVRNTTPVIHQTATYFAINPNARAHIESGTSNQPLIEAYGIRGKESVKVRGWAAFKGDHLHRVEYVVNSTVIGYTDANQLVAEGQLADFGDTPYYRFEQMLDVSAFPPGAYNLRINFMSVQNEQYWAETPLIIEV